MIETLRPEKGPILHSAIGIPFTMTAHSRPGFERTLPRLHLLAFELEMTCVSVADSSRSGLITEACNSAGDLDDRGDEKPDGGAFDGSFEVFGEATATVQPWDCPLDHPSCRQQFEAFGNIGSADNFQGPCADFGERGAQFVPGISPNGENVAQPREGLADAGKDVGRTVAILDIGGVNDSPDQQALRVCDDMVFAALDRLACVKSPWVRHFPLFSRFGYR